MNAERIVYLCRSCAAGWDSVKLYHSDTAAPPKTPCHECGDAVGNKVYIIYLKEAQRHACGGRNGPATETGVTTPKGKDK